MHEKGTKEKIYVIELKKAPVSNTRQDIGTKLCSIKSKCGKPVDDAVVGHLVYLWSSRTLIKIGKKEYN